MTRKARFARMASMALCVIFTVLFSTHLLAADNSLGRFQEIPLDNPTGHVTVQLPRDGMIVLRLQATPSAGNLWRISNPAEIASVVREVKGSKFGPDMPEFDRSAPALVGSPRTQVLRLVGTGAGRAAVRLEYASFTGEVVSTIVVDVASEGVFSGTFTAPQPPRHPASARPSSIMTQGTPASGLPANFDWRTYGKVTPVRDQRPCGTCWAFANCALFECKLKITENLLDANDDLSEEYLLQQVQWAQDTQRFGYWALDYFWDDAHCGGCGAGARQEIQCPYCCSGRKCSGNGECMEPGWCIPSTTYKNIAGYGGWFYADGDSDSAKPLAIHPTTTDQLKAAIYKYGPVGTAVEGSGWGGNPPGYAGGVYGHCPDTFCWPLEEASYDDVDHAVVIVGWEDDSSCFIIKNSWGTCFGEGGYIKVGYGCSLVGANAVYIGGHDGSLGRVDPLVVTAPNGGETWNCGSTHAVTWKSYSGFSQYGISTVKIELLKGGSPVSTIAASRTATDTLYNWTIPTSLLPGDDYQIQVSSGTGDSTKSDASDGFFAIADTSRPAPPTLTVDRGRYTDAISWYAVGDDSLTGTASEYDLRMLNGTITESNFPTSPRITTSAPGEPGIAECVAVSNLMTCTTYTVALKVKDDAGHWSAMSNVANANTNCTGSKIAACHTGERAIPAPGEDIPSALFLSAPRPNPARDLISFDYGVPSGGIGRTLTVGAYDVLGRLVQSLADGPARAGQFHLSWSLTNQSGTPVKPGIYFVRLRLDEKQLVRAVNVVR